MKRSLSNFEKDYLYELELYEKALYFTTLVSINQHSIETDARGARAVRIFTRQTLSGISLHKLLPKPTVEVSDNDDFWDISSIASLSRNIIEGYLSLYYFGTEKISEAEAELRFFILQLHKNVEWYHIRKIIDQRDPELPEFEKTIYMQKAQIKNHEFVENLSPENKQRAIRGIEMYKTKYDFEKQNPVCKDLIVTYRRFSNLTHPVPISIERIDDEHGRGSGSDRDVAYSILLLMNARKYLAASVVDIVEHFPNELLKKFPNETASVKELIFEGFD